MTDREIMQMALEALDSKHDMTKAEWRWLQYRAFNELRERLLQPEQEPVAWADKHDVEREGHDFYVNRQQPAKNGIPLYTAPPQREWQGLTSEERYKAIRPLYRDDKSAELAAAHSDDEYQAIETKLKEKNT